jgi:hypothetical protein
MIPVLPSEYVRTRFAENRSRGHDEQGGPSAQILQLARMDAAWDVHRAKVFSRCETKSGIAPVDRLIQEVMSQNRKKRLAPAA